LKPGTTPIKYHPSVVKFELDQTQKAPVATKSAIAPLKYGYEIGSLYAHSLDSDSSDKHPIDTGYVLVLNVLDNSLWLVLNYYQQNDEGERKFLDYDGVTTSVIPGLEEESFFDLSRIFATASLWDPAKPSSSLIPTLEKDNHFILRLIPSPVEEAVFLKEFSSSVAAKTTPSSSSKTAPAPAA
jgi:hypothetical protein